LAQNIRYIALSDLHLGAENSILTRLRPESTLADPVRPSPVLTSLAECLRVLVAGNSDGSLPTLIADGDLVELALASPSFSLPVVAQFAGALAGRDAVVHDEVIFVPGNHDHHLWEMSRERAVEEFLKSGGRLEDKPLSWHTSPMFLERTPAFRADFLEDAMGYLGHPRLGVRVAYPDLAIASPDGRRLVLVTHGHYMERVGTLVSALARLFEPSAPPLDDVDVIERENWAWVDFFWSELAQSSRTGAVVERLYDSMQDTRAIETLLGSLIAGVTRRQNPLLRRIESWGVRRVLGHIIEGRLHERERDRAAEVLDAGSRKGLAAYLDAVRHSLQRQVDGGELPLDVSVITGHTHKPFSERWDDPGWPGGGLRVFNCGGWVVDRVEPQPLTGGALVLVSDELDVVSLRLYQQTPDPSSHRIVVETVEPGPGGQAFAEHVESLVRDDEEPWTSFRQAVNELVLERRVVMREILEGELELLRD